VKSTSQGETLYSHVMDTHHDPNNTPHPPSPCPLAAELIGQHIGLPDGTTGILCDTDHTHAQGQHTCWLILDGTHRHPLPPGRIKLSVLDRRPVPLRHDDETLTFADAVRLIRDYQAAYEALWPTPRRGPAPRYPRTPPTTESHYTRARVRRVHATGRWAANIGWAGTTRSLGEYDSPQQAADACWEANRQAWDDLEAWCRQHVAGPWDGFERGSTLDIQMADRVTAEQAAELAGITRATWDGYRSRGDVPEPAGEDPGTGVLTWDRVEVLEWIQSRPGQGRRTDLDH
jgi:predicted DNA-binding transcriptional regulator AlpA